jgi:dTDP-4-dehydrorhamnose 3,5-epimerase
MVIESTRFPGLFILDNAPFQDSRGSFHKFYNKNDLSAVKFIPKESFYTVSAKSVIRGMHFLTGAYACSKLITITAGRVLDVILDLRHSSPTFSQYVSFELSRDGINSILIPEGCAHGFLSLEANSTLIYMSSKVYSPSHDTGVRFDSFGFNWDISHPIISGRDMKLPTFNVEKTYFK